MVKTDERNLFPAALRIIEEVRPKAVMIENVRGLRDAVFEDYRTYVEKQLEKLGYESDWGLLNARDFGVSPIAAQSGVCVHAEALRPKISSGRSVGKKRPQMLANGCTT